jgi:acetylornithine/N-succinyldiaminopimelate aminotransferase
MVDEVQCGIARTGKWFAHQHAGILPDVMTLAKGLGSGVPIGACLTAGRAANVFKPGNHGSTFGGNPLAMAVGNAVLDCLLEPDFLPRVEGATLRLKQHLARLKDEYPSIVEDVRGMGLLLGIKLKKPVPDLVRACLDEKLLTVGAGDNVMRLLPPLNVKDDELAEAAQRLDRALRRLA